MCKYLFSFISNGSKSVFTYNHTCFISLCSFSIGAVLELLQVFARTYATLTATYIRVHAKLSKDTITYGLPNTCIYRSTHTCSCNEINPKCLFSIPNVSYSNGLLYACACMGVYVCYLLAASLSCRPLFVCLCLLAASFFLFMLLLISFFVNY